MAKNKGIEEIKNQLDQGIKEVMTSEKFQKWLLELVDKYLESFLLFSFASAMKLSGYSGGVED